MDLDNPETIRSRPGGLCKTIGNERRLERYRPGPGRYRRDRIRSHVAAVPDQVDDFGCARMAASKRASCSGVAGAWCCAFQSAKGMP